jgi:CRP-like cAMP-binding protein
MRLENALPDRERNRILGALPEPVYRRLLPELSFVSLDVADVLYEPGQAISALYFPVDGVVSLVTPLEDGAIVEVATIGNEGIVGVPLGSGGAPATVRAISQVAGASLRIGTGVFASAVAKDGPFGTLVRSYEQALFSQIAQAAACNRLHSNEERLSRWLLMSHDRVGRDEFAITQEFLAQMLGSRRATVTLSAGILQRAGLIRYRRGHMIIVDREGLENASCECYRTIKNTLDRVLLSPWPATPDHRRVSARD